VEALKSDLSLIETERRNVRVTVRPIVNMMFSDTSIEKGEHTISDSWFEIRLKPRRNPIEERRKEERLDVKPIMRDEKF